MELNTVMQMITQVGFPIAMCLLLAWYAYTKDKSHKQEIDDLSSAVHEQTLNIQKLVDKIDQMIRGDSK